MPADAHFEQHTHPWAQLAYYASGVAQVTAAAKSGNLVSYIVPPSRAVWIAPGAEHQVTMIKAAECRTLYIQAAAVPGAARSRMLVVSPLLREAIKALDAPTDHPLSRAREQLLSQLVIDEITRADTQALGVPLPHPQNGNKRLRALCYAALRNPGQRTSLAEWATDMGARERTAARLFKQELGMRYLQWRQQAVLANALPLLASGQSISRVASASASGYNSVSAFSAMFKTATGHLPSHFQVK